MNLLLQAPPLQQHHGNPNHPVPAVLRRDVNPAVPADILLHSRARLRRYGNLLMARKSYGGHEGLGGRGGRQRNRVQVGEE